MIRIRQASRIAASETASTRDELKKAENEVAVKVHQLYFDILATGLQKRAADQETAYAQVHLRESEEDIQKGNALKISAIDSQASLLQSEQDTLTAELQLKDLTIEFNDLLGLPLDTPLELAARRARHSANSPARRICSIRFGGQPGNPRGRRKGSAGEGRKCHIGEIRIHSRRLGDAKVAKLSERSSVSGP